LTAFFRFEELISKEGMKFTRIKRLNIPRSARIKERDFKLEGIAIERKGLN